MRYSLRVLEEQSLIEPTGEGAIATTQASEFVEEFDGKIDAVIDRLEGIKISEELEVNH